MRALTCIRGYYPSEKHGGPPISVRNLCELTSDKVEYYIITTDHDMGETKRFTSISEGWNKVDDAFVLYMSESKEKIGTFLAIAKQVRPDFIYLHSLFDRYTLRMLIVGKILRIPCILATRGELSENLYKGKKKTIKDSYIFALSLLGLLKTVTFHATYPEEAIAIEKKLSNANNRIFTISNVPAGQAFIRKRINKKPNTLKAVYVSRIVENKNLFEVIEALKAVESDVSLDIYGFKQDLSYWEKCEKLFGELPNNVQIMYKGELKHKDVIATVSNYDTLIFPTFSENYGQIIAEAIISSCPPIISDRTPWGDIADMGAGIIVPLHDIHKLTEAIETIAWMDSATYNTMLENMENYYKKKINLESILEQYITMYSSACVMKGQKA